MKSNNSSYLTQVKALIRLLGGHVNLLAFPKIFIDITGDITLAVMLSQLLYWSDRTSDPQGYVYKSADDWKKEVGASRYAVQKFKYLPYIRTKIKRAEGSPTSFYKIEFSLLMDTISCFLSPSLQVSSSQPAENDPSLTYITPDTTTDTIYIQGCPPEKELANSAFVTVMPEEVSSENDDDQEDDLHEISARFSSDADIQAFVSKLAEITGFDITFPVLNVRITNVAVQLRDSGYSVHDLDGFFSYWRSNDWRWKKDKQLPSPEDVISQIKRSLDYKTRGRRDYYAAWKR